MGTKKGISSLYVLKALCALFVVMNHSSILGKETLMPILRCAVPCFFLISGYFLYSAELGKVRQKLWKNLKKIFLITLAVNGVFVLYRFAVCTIPLCRGLGSNGHIALTWNKIADIFLTGRGGYPHLWYLTAYAWALVLLLLFVRKTDRFTYVFPFFFLVSLLLGKYSFVLFPGIEFGFSLQVNALTVALPIVSLGYLMHKYESRLLNFRLLNILPAVFIISAFAENYLMEAFRINIAIEYWACTLPLACSLLLLALKYKDFYIPCVCEIGKSHSANIYYFHVIPLSMVRILLPSLQEIGAIVVFLMSWGISVVLEWMQKVVQHWWQRRLNQREPLKG